MWGCPLTYHLLYVFFLIIGCPFLQMCVCGGGGGGRLSLSRRSGISIYLPQTCAPLPPSDSVWSLSFAKVLPTPIECLTLRLPSPRGGLGSSCPPPPLDPAEQALCARRPPISGEGVGARGAGRAMADGLVGGREGAPGPAPSLPRLSPHFFWEANNRGRFLSLARMSWGRKQNPDPHPQTVQILP